MKGKDLKEPKAIEIELDKTRNLIFDMNAFVEIEETYDSFFEAFADMENMKIKAIRCFVHACLIHEDENLTLKQVGKMINHNNLEYVVSCLSKAVDDNMPEAEEGQKSNGTSKKK